MDERLTLRSHLDRSASQTPHGAAVGKVIEAIAAAAIELAALIADGPLAGITGRVDGVNSDGDQQKDIDVAADDIMRSRVESGPGCRGLSEEAALPETLDPEAPLCVAIDPLDGSANLENNISVGTIFSIRPRGNDILSTFFEPGTAQCAAGFIVYGPQTTPGARAQQDTSISSFSIGASAQFVLIKRERPDCARYAGICHQCVQSPALARAGSRLYRRMPRRQHAATRGADFNMRWIGSLVAEALRILVRGGVFLYPADARPGYREGRLRLLYEAHPDGAGDGVGGRRGHAPDGRRILELGAKTPHQRVPLIMGSLRARSRRRGHSRRHRADVRQQ